MLELTPRKRPPACRPRRSSADAGSAGAMRRASRASPPGIGGIAARTSSAASSSGAMARSATGRSPAMSCSTAWSRRSAWLRGVTNGCSIGGVLGRGGQPRPLILANTAERRSVTRQVGPAPLGSAASVEPRRQIAQRPMQEDAHGARRSVRAPRAISAVEQAVDEAQQDDLAAVIGHLRRPRAGSRGASSATRDQAGGIGIGRGSLEVVGQRLGPPSSAAAVRVGDGVVRDAEEPRPEGRPLVAEVRRARPARRGRCARWRPPRRGGRQAGRRRSRRRGPGSGGTASRTRRGRPARRARPRRSGSPVGAGRLASCGRPPLAGHARLPRRRPHPAGARHAPPRPRQRPGPRGRHRCRAAAGPASEMPAAVPASRSAPRSTVTSRPSSAETRGQPRRRASPRAPATRSRHPAR